MTLPLPAIQIELTPEEERRARAYIWAIVARADLSTVETEREAARLWEQFAALYAALITGPYSKPSREAFRTALGRI